jgi:hypothetical protein
VLGQEVAQRPPALQAVGLLGKAVALVREDQVLYRDTPGLQGRNDDETSAL